MIFKEILILQSVYASCSLYIVECFELGARLTLNSSCYNSTQPLFSSDSSGVFLVYDNETVLHDCDVSNQIGASLAILEYGNCFQANSANERQSKSMFNDT